MVAEGFNCTVKITGGILGTAVAITAVSACIAPLLHCPDDDDDNDTAQLRQTVHTVSMIQKPQSALVRIFLNGLRNIGVVSPQCEREKNQSAHVRKASSRLPPVVPVIVISKNPPNAQEMQNFAIYPQQVFEERDDVSPDFHIKVVQPKSTQGTQTDHDDDRNKMTERQSSTLMENSRESRVTDQGSSGIGTLASSLNTQDRSSRSVGSQTSACIQSPTSNHVESLITEHRTPKNVSSQTSVCSHSTRPDEIHSAISDRSMISVGLQTSVRSHSSPRIQITSPISGDNYMPAVKTPSFTVPAPKWSDSKTQTGGCDVRPQGSVALPITKPPRAHPPKKVLVPAQIHRDAPVQTPDDSADNRIVGESSPEQVEIGLTPKRGLDPPSLTMSRRKCFSESTLASDSPRSLSTKLRKLLEVFIPKFVNDEQGSRHHPRTVGQTNASDPLSHVRCMPRAETSRSNCVIQDLDNERSLEPHSTSNLMSSTRRLDRSATVGDGSSYLNLPSGHRSKETECYKVFQADVERIRRKNDAWVEAVIRSNNDFPTKHGQSEINEALPCRSPEKLRCEDQQDLGTSISDPGPNCSSNHGKKRRFAEIGRRVRDFIRGRDKGKKLWASEGSFETSLK